MKYKTIMTLFVIIVLSNTLIYAKPASIKYPISTSHTNTEDKIRELNLKITYIEKAVQELQNHMFEQQNEITSIYSCYIKTPFDGTFLANGKTEAEAKGRTLQKCQKKSGCSENKLTCSKSTSIKSNKGTKYPIKIQSTPSNNSSINALENRLHTIEQALIELQKKIVLTEETITKEKERLYSCYLKTPFHGTVSASGKTEAEAKGLTLQKCKNNPGCSDKKITCSHTN